MPLYRLLVAGLLLLALVPLPYGYYQFLRLAVCAAAAYSAWEEFKRGLRVLAWLFVGVALLFNPLAPVHLDRATWFWIDIAGAVFFVVSALARKRESGTR